MQFKTFTVNISDSQMVLTCVDIILPTVTTIPSTVTFLFQLIFQQPEVQRKIQAEIDRVVGSGRAPTLDDRIKLVNVLRCIFFIKEKKMCLFCILAYRILKPVCVK